VQSATASAGADITRRPRIAAGVAFTGAFLILIAVGNQISTPLKPGDADAAQMRLANVPLKSQNLTFKEPDNAAWQRLGKSWGKPSYVLTVELARNEQGCWDDFKLDVKSAAALTPMTDPAFGHVNECGGRTLGLKFQGPVDFQIVVSDQGDFPPAELAILPVWPGDMKQRLGDAYLDERLSVIARWVLGAGVLLALAGVVGMWPAAKTGR
jgi:hypothetical protein